MKILTELLLTDALKEKDMSKELYTALAKAQAEIKNPPLNKTGQATSTVKYKYSDLACTLESIKPSLNKYGLSLIQLVDIKPDLGVVLLTRICHESGAHIESMYPLKETARPQEMGSQITYARRYSITAMLAIAGEEDDDGALAQKETQNDTRNTTTNRDTKQPGKSSSTSLPASQTGLHNTPKNGSAQHEQSRPVHNSKPGSTNQLATEKAGPSIFVDKTFQEIFIIEQSTGFEWGKKRAEEINKGTRKDEWVKKYLSYVKDMGVSL